MIKSEITHMFDSQNKTKIYVTKFYENGTTFTQYLLFENLKAHPQV